MDELRQSLIEGLKALEMPFDDPQLQQLESYLYLLHKWNRAYNLTAVRDIRDMIGRHLLDSLAIAPYVSGDRVLDLGSGAGLPGIPLAIMQPWRHFLLVDSNGKKSRFQTQALLELGLANVEVLSGRVESLQLQDLPETLVSRAFASLTQMLEATAGLCPLEGRFLAMKGRYPAEEIARLPAAFHLAASHRLAVPQVAGVRHLLILERST